MSAAPAPSARLLRAVAAEREQLARHRARLTSEATELRAALARIEHGLAEIDERRTLLDRLAPPDHGERREPAPERPAAPARGGEAGRGPVGAAGGEGGRALAGGGEGGRGPAGGGDAPAGGGESGGGPTEGARASAGGGGGGSGPAGGYEAGTAPGAVPLRGPAIRETAVALLVEHGLESLHYRAWFDMLREHGHVIAGKDPLAVLLTQLSRSPVLRKGGRAGVYELDREAPARLRAQLDELHRALRATTTATGGLAEVRVRRTRITREIARVERAIEEVGRVLPRSVRAA